MNRSEFYHMMRDINENAFAYRTRGYYMRDWEDNRDKFTDEEYYDLCGGEADAKEFDDWDREY